MRTIPEIAWAAGLFEGEGCFSYPQKKAGARSRPRVMLTTTDEDVLRRFAAVVRVGHVSGPRRHKQAGTEHHKPYFTWFTGTFEGMQAVAAMFWPFLGARRRARAKQLLEFLRDRPRKFHDGAYCNAKLTLAQAREIVSLRGVLSQKVIAAKFGLSQTTVSDIQLGKSWSHASEAA